MAPSEVAIHSTVQITSKPRIGDAISRRAQTAAGFLDMYGHLPYDESEEKEAAMGSRDVLKAQRRHTKQERLEARIPAAQKRMLERAASLRGTTLTDFVLASAQEAATKTIKDFEMLTLCDEAREVFIKALLNPPAPNKALRAAANRYRKVVGS